MFWAIRKLEKRLLKYAPGRPFVFLAYQAVDGRRRVFCGRGEGVAAGSEIKSNWTPNRGEQVLDLGAETSALRRRVAAKLQHVRADTLLDCYQKELRDEGIKEEQRS